MNSKSNSNLDELEKYLTNIDPNKMQNIISEIKGSKESSNQGQDRDSNDYV